MSCRVCNGEKAFMCGAISDLGDAVYVRAVIDPETKLMQITANVNGEDQLVDEYDSMYCPECGEQLRF